MLGGTIHEWVWRWGLEVGEWVWYIGACRNLIVIRGDGVFGLDEEEELGPVWFVKGFGFGFRFRFGLGLRFGFGFRFGFEFGRSSSEAIAILSKIYDPYRLKDELDQLSVSLEEKRISMSSVRYQEVFRNKEITLAFVAIAGLQCIQLQEDIKKQLSAEGKYTEEELEEYMNGNKKLMIRSLWNLNVVDIEATLFVLQNATVKSEDLRARAKGLRTLGQIF
ncbi:chaperone protein DnaJ 10-like protein [Tanacetum coccineum]